MVKYFLGMKPLKLRQLLVRSLWFAALIIGIFVVINRLQRQAARKTRAATHFVPDTLAVWEQPYASVPDA